MNSHQAAWAWILEHLRVIEYTSKKMCPPKMDLEDFYQELLCDVASKWQGYNSNKGKPSNWVYGRGLAVRKRFLYKHRRQLPPNIWNYELLFPNKNPDLDSLILLRQVHQEASPEGQEAFMAVVEGWRGKELIGRGLTAPEVRRRLKIVGKSYATG
jgi:hypothetical protein